MLKKIACLALAAALLLAALPALALDTGADPLTWEELTAWVGEMAEQTEKGQLMNDPHEAALVTADGYTFAYDFATFYMDKPVFDAESRIRSVVVNSDEAKGPRGIDIWMHTADVVAAFYNENPDLDGTWQSAVLYVSDNLPESLLWATVTRDGQRVNSVQYTVHQRLEDGTYTDAGLICVIEDDRVAAIRAYGLDAAISLEDVEGTRGLLLGELGQRGYTAVPTSDTGTDLQPLTAEDLTMGGVPFLTVTPEQAIEALGDPEADDVQEDGGASLRVVTFEDCELTFEGPADGSAWVLRNFTAREDGIEGPRGVRVGDDLNTVMRRFRYGEGTIDTEGRVLPLYGAAPDAPYGVAVYAADASSELTYAAALEDGTAVAFLCVFDPQQTLTEMMIYRVR